MDEAERVAEEIAEALANNEAHLLADCALMTRSDKIIVASILRNELEAARREYQDPRAMCSGCAGKTVHHTCGKEPDADQTQAYLDKQIALCARREASEEDARVCERRAKE